jgi:hypothetical protein
MTTLSDRIMASITETNLRYRNLYARFPMLQAHFLRNRSESDIVDQIIWTIRHAAAFYQLTPEHMAEYYVEFPEPRLWDAITVFVPEETKALVVELGRTEAARRGWPTW